MQALSAHGFALYQLDDSRIADGQTFFNEVAKTLAFPEYFGYNWDALIDCLGDLEDRPTRRAAIVWRHADRAMRHDLQVFLEAVHIFLTVAADLGRYREDGGEPVQLELFLTGKVFQIPSPSVNSQALPPATR